MLVIFSNIEIFCSSVKFILKVIHLDFIVSNNLNDILCIKIIISFSFGSSRILSKALPALTFKYSVLLIRTIL